jgi:ATP-dependent Clp protease ATP-binding subunit ClpB
VIVFHPLRREEVRRIVDLQVTALAKLLERNGLGLVVTDAVRQEVANRGYDPAYGARPLKRVIQQQLQNPLASALLRGEHADGATVTIDFVDGEFAFAIG